MTEDHPVIPWLTERRRAFFYRLITPLSALAAAYGVANDARIAAWVSLVGFVLSGGMAIANTSTALPED
jgi:hypothetical protein